MAFRRDLKLMAGEQDEPGGSRSENADLAATAPRPVPAGGALSEARPGALLHNERVRLTATFLNIIAAGFVTVGAIGPAAGILYGINTTQRQAWELTAEGAGWAFLGVVLHGAARWYLRLRLIE